MSDVFIFYSRCDIDLARHLFDQLARDREACADWQGISPTTIYRGIESADSCLFIINPNSAFSEICSLEIEHTIKHPQAVDDCSLERVRR